jgi:large subunit ribosomal protein LP0
MSAGDGTRAKKEAYFTKLNSLLEEYSTIFIVTVDNVGSNQMHQIRHALRGEATVLMGKNTMVRKVLRSLVPENPSYEKLMGQIVGNIGFVFTKGDLKAIKKMILSNRVAAPAKAGAIAPVDVVIPAGNTGMGPEKTSFFQALGVATKIARGTIEIISNVELIKAGTKVLVFIKNRLVLLKQLF